MKRSSVTTVARSRLLLLMRHGKAAPKDVGLSDFERALTANGIVECQRIAHTLAGRLSGVDGMISSPADRALETAHIFADALGYPTERIELMTKLYSAESARAVLAKIRITQPRAMILALVGHNPLFDDLASHLIPGSVQSIDKAGVIAISFGRLPWSDIRKGAGQLAFTLAPSNSNRSLSGTTRKSAP